MPSTSDLLGEEAFADLYFSWDETKLSCFIVCKVLGAPSGDDYRKTDSLELFIDTRDLKTKGVVSRFCHHFVFSPHQIQNFHGREVTRFRGEDIHRLCHPEDLHVEPKITDSSYRILIEIPSKCLYGYDPVGFPRLGFTYRINRSKGFPQHFAVSSEEYVIEQHPATWGTLKLVKD
ncbi:MAG: hypothetical protein FJZ64_03755 [Chlamydiae bacterium]|nr:hypothetical protein [Chlamydiota bacterium]